MGSLRESRSDGKPALSFRRVLRDPFWIRRPSSPSRQVQATMALGGRRRSVNQRQHAEHDDLWATWATSLPFSSAKMLGLSRGEEAWLLSKSAQSREAPLALRPQHYRVWTCFAKGQALP